LLFNLLGNLYFADLDILISLPFPVFARNVYDIDCISLNTNCYNELANYRSRVLLIGIFLSTAYILLYIFLYNKFGKSIVTKVMLVIMTVVVLLASPIMGLIFFYTFQ
jgi:membrane-associated HD superfamily phosphohydrolase